MDKNKTKKCLQVGWSNAPKRFKSLKALHGTASLILHFLFRTNLVFLFVCICYILSLLENSWNITTRKIKKFRWLASGIDKNAMRHRNRPQRNQPINSLFLCPRSIIPAILSFCLASVFGELHLVFGIFCCIFFLFSSLIIIYYKITKRNSLRAHFPHLLCPSPM